MFYRHGHSTKRSPEYSSWSAMRRRCCDENHVAYPRYGGKGIKICDRWLGPNGFQNFLADVGPRPSGCTLDRIDNSGHYEPDNVRWATRSEQAFNRTPKILVTAFGKSQTIQAWSKETGVSVNSIHYRIAHGWDAERAVSQPTDPWRRKPR
jgi:hypothetical protein